MWKACWGRGKVMWHFFYTAPLKASADAHFNLESFLGGTSGASAGSCLKRSSSSFKLFIEESLLQRLQLSRPCYNPPGPFHWFTPTCHHVIKYLLIWFRLLISKPWGFFICITNHLLGLFTIWLLCTLHFLFLIEKNSLWHWKWVRKGCSGDTQEPSSAPPLQVKPALGALDPAHPGGPSQWHWGD